MKILAVDYGDVRTGLAISDNSEFLASPVGTLTERDPRRLAQKISQTAQEHGAKLIVVGLPINMNGTKDQGQKGARSLHKCSKSLLTVLLKCGTNVQRPLRHTISSTQRMYGGRREKLLLILLRRR